jgi:hypothetical protein
MASLFAPYAPAVMQPRSFNDLLTRLEFVRGGIVDLENTIREKRITSVKGKQLIEIYRLLADDVSDANKVVLEERRKELETALDEEMKQTMEYVILTIEKRQEDAIKQAMISQYGAVFII